MNINDIRAVAAAQLGVSPGNHEIVRVLPNVLAVGGREHFYPLQGIATLHSEPQGEELVCDGETMTATLASADVALTLFQAGRTLHIVAAFKAVPADEAAVTVALKCGATTLATVGVSAEAHTHFEVKLTVEGYVHARITADTTETVSAGTIAPDLGETAAAITLVATYGSADDIVQLEMFSVSITA